MVGYRIDSMISRGRGPIAAHETLSVIFLTYNRGKCPQGIRTGNAQK